MTSNNYSLSKYKEKISQYEDADNPLAPLTNDQRQFIFDVTHDVPSRPIPQTLKIIPKPSTVDPGSELNCGIRWDHLKFTNKEEFNEWFHQIENQIEDDKSKDVTLFVENVEKCRDQSKDLLDEVVNILEDLNTLQENYHFVSNKTNSLHDSCQQLIEEQVKLEKVSREIDANINHFLQLDRIASKLSAQTILVTSDSFFEILEQIDSCLSFMLHNPTFKESNIFLAKYKHCLNRAISQVKSYVNLSLQDAAAECKAKCQIAIQSNPQETKESNSFPIVYGKFSAGIAQLKRLFTEIEKRKNGWPEYGELFNETQQSFFKERANLLSGNVWAMVAELNNRGKSGIDLCSTVRTGCIFCIHLCQDEFRLYGDFFNPQYTTLFDEFMESLCTPLYDTLRPLIIKIQHLETLAEMCSIFRGEMLEERAANGIGLNSFVRIIEQLLQDTQERLVYRAHIYISTDIRNYNPGPGDLAYPEKLEMMERIAETLDQTEEAKMKPLVRSNSQSSLLSIGSVTSLEVAAINSATALQIPRPLKSSSSPADLTGLWYPSLRRTLLCLSKLYRCLDKSIFQGLSQEALTACIANISTAANAISTRSTVVDAQLFEIKNLLILREQIAPFQVDFAVKEMSLDFSRIKNAAMSLLKNKKQVFSISNNSLLEFIVDGTPVVKEYFLDSKKEVDRQLKSTCELFIVHCTQLLIGDLKNFLIKAQKVAEAQKDKPEISLSQQSFALPNILSQLIHETIESLKSKLPFISRSMKLYLANKETEFILFRPVKNNVLNEFLQLENITMVHYATFPDVVCPTQEQLNVIISSVMIQNEQALVVKG